MDYRYHCTIPAASGRNVLPFNPCATLDFALLRLGVGESWTGGSGDREILAVVLGGRANLVVDGHRFERVGGRSDVFSGKPHSVYIPANTMITVEALGPVEIAMPSAPSDAAIQPYLITPDRVTAGRSGAANFSGRYHQILTAEAQPDLPARRLIVGETYAPSGNWSAFPPHRHAVDNLPVEAAHEEMHYFRVGSPGGFAISRVSTEDGYEENFTARDHSVQMLPGGYHTVASAPGCTTYYLWCLAGAQRTQASVEDSDLAWVGRSVAMLRELGH